jgi:hypothetical protein
MPFRYGSDALENLKKNKIISEFLKCEGKKGDFVTIMTLDVSLY